MAKVATKRNNRNAYLSNQITLTERSSHQVSRMSKYMNDNLDFLAQKSRTMDM